MNVKSWAEKQKARQKTLGRVERSRSSERHSFKWLYKVILIFAVGLPAAAVFGVYSYRHYSERAGLEFSGDTIYVKAGGNFQGALNQAKPGDTILLQAGAAFKGSFELPTKAGEEFITIRTSAPDEQLPPAGRRIDPSKYAALLPKLSSPTTAPVIFAKDGAHHYRFVAVEFGGTKEGLYNIIQLGTAEEKRIEDLPHHIEFDRVYIHATAPEGQRRAIAANGKFIKIANSHISDIKRMGEESAAIGIWATDGPVEIVNNYLEASAINILFGGGESYLKLVPTDCVVRDNWLNKRLEWRETDWIVKNLFEIKFGRRIKVENNLMTNNWGMGQDGTAIVFTVRADIGETAVIEDVEFTGNVVRGTGNGINVYGAEARGGHRLTIRNNFFEDVDGRKWNGGGHFLKSTEWDDLLIENNTIIQTGNITLAYGEPTRGFVFRNNVVFENEYGVFGDGIGSGKPALDRYFPGGDVSFNAVIGGNASLYHGRNLFPDSAGQVGFVNFGAKDYRLRPDSPLHGRGFGGKSIGADLEVKTVGGK